MGRDRGSRSASGGAVTMLEPAVECCAPLAAPTCSTRSEAIATAELFKALADPARVRIVNAARDEPASPCAPASCRARSGSRSRRSRHHLKKLTDAGLLEREQRGKWAYFSL